MKNMRFINRTFYALLFAVIINYSFAQNILKVEVNKPVAKVSPSMWGVFFEDINFGADGGLYAELVKNRSFEFFDPLMGWSEMQGHDKKGKILIVNVGSKSPQNTRIANITVDAEKGSYGISNEGFRGIGVKKGGQYNFSILAKKPAESGIKIHVELVNSKGVKLGETTIDGFTESWAKYKGSFTSSDTDAKARLNVIFEGKGSIDVDMISLFPNDTWKNRPNGLRTDLVQLLADLKPGFLRFPGGCIVEGRELDTRYQWKKTVGNIENRTPAINRWNTEFKHRATSDYYQSFGLGFYEYFLLSEDIGAEALPILNCGMACQYNTAEVAPMDALDPYVQDAIDLIEFANADTSNKWGKLRAEMGHPAPFNLKFLGVGNEQWDEQYIERYKVFAKALKEKFPQVQLISAAGPDPDGKRFDYAWRELKTLNADLIDEHYYRSPEWFFKNANRYDNYDRKGPKVFAGEYASHGKDTSDPESKNTWLSALSEAAFMTGLERNADVVKLASYAPLLAHVEAWQWRPDMIWFDNLRAVATPNYYVQKLYSTNKGTEVIPALADGKVLAGQDSTYASAVVDKTKGEVIIKFVNASSKPVDYTFKINGKKVTGNTSMQVLSSTDLYKYNTLDDQQLIYPKEIKLGKSKNELKVAIEPSSFNVITIPTRI